MRVVSFVLVALVLASVTVSAEKGNPDLAQVRRDLESVLADLASERAEGTEANLAVSGEEGEWPEVLKKWLAKGSKYILAGTLSRNAWANEEARDAIVKLAMSGLVPCPSLPRNGEELAEHMVDLGKYFAGASCDPKASPINQAKMMMLTESLTDFQSTCGYLPNLLLALGGVSGKMCSKWRHINNLFSASYRLDATAGTCQEPFFNRKYIVKNEGGAAKPYNWWSSEGMSGGKAPPQFQHNFGALFAQPTWKKFNRKSPQITKADLPKAGDFYFVMRRDKGEAGHVGLVKSVTDEAPDSSDTDVKQWKFTFKTIDAGQTCGYKPLSWRSVPWQTRGFSYKGYQCVTDEKTYSTRQFKYGSSGGHWGLLNYWPLGNGINRLFQGHMNVRAIVDDTSAPIPLAERFNTATRWCTPHFSRVIKLPPNPYLDDKPPAKKPAQPSNPYDGSKPPMTLAPNPYTDDYKAPNWIDRAAGGSTGGSTGGTGSDPCACRKETKARYQGSCDDWDNSGYKWCYVEGTNTCSDGKVGIYGLRYRKCTPPQAPTHRSFDPCACRTTSHGLYKGKCADWDRSGHNWCYVVDKERCTNGKVGVLGLKYRKC